MILKILDWVAIVLLIIGGLDLGSVGIFNYDPLVDLLAEMLIVAHVLFFLIGLAAIYMIIRAVNYIKLLSINVT